MTKSFFTGFIFLLSISSYALKVDVHSHLDQLGGANINELVSAMDNKGIDYMFLMPTPEPLVHPVSSDNTTSSITSFVSTYSGYENRFKFLYGGSELNFYLHGAGRLTEVPSLNRWTDDDDTQYSVYPNGCPGSTCSSLIADGLIEAQDIEYFRNDTGTGSYYQQFISVANAAAMSGQYVGFGEIGALHYSRRPGHPYVHFPIDHLWMKELSDIAGSYCMTIDLHAELDSTTAAELDNLLLYNENTNIVLEHVGWSTNNEDQLSLLEPLMATYGNLYLALRKCNYTEGVDTCYIEGYSGSSPSVKSDWLSFINTYSDRIMIGSDAKFWQDSGVTAQQTLNKEYRDKDPSDHLGSLNLLIQTLGVTSTAAQNIMGNTADNLYHLTSSFTCGSSVSRSQHQRMCKK